MVFHPTKVAVDPKIWKKMSERDYEAAEWNYEGGFYIQSAGFCHGTIEKALKLHLATTGKLNDKLSTHKLNVLAEAAGLWYKIEPGDRKWLADISRLHEDTSYPYNEMVYRQYNEPGFARLLLMKTSTMRKWILEEVELAEKGEGGEDGQGSRRQG